MFFYIRQLCFSTCGALPVPCSDRFPGGVLAASWQQFRSRKTSKIAFEASCSLSGRLAAVLADLGVVLGDLGPVLGLSWGGLGRSWGGLGRSRGGLGAVLGDLGSVLGGLGAVLDGLRRSRVSLGRSGGVV